MATIFRRRRKPVNILQMPPSIPGSSRLPRVVHAVERIGHRGAPRELPENTLPSFVRALERGADALELDVHATADGVVVVHHDPELRGGALDARRIATLPHAAVAGHELAPGITVPTLADVLAVARERATVYVEIKGRDIEAAVVAVIRAGVTRCAVHSFDHAAIGRARALAPEIPRGILFDDAPRDVVASMRAVGARDVWPERTLADHALIAAVHGAGGRVMVWTVNSAADAERLARAGVDGVCTDDLRVLGELPALSG